MTNACYEIEIDHETKLPVAFHIQLLAGVKNETELSPEKKIVGGRHVAFHFSYKLTEFGKARVTEMPKEAQKVLAKI